MYQMLYNHRSFETNSLCHLVYVIPLVCGSRARQRNVTYYLDEVCKLHIGGNMAKEDFKPYLKKHGSSMEDATNEWLNISKAALQQWPGKEEFKHECPVTKQQLKTVKKMNAFPVMYFLEYLEILKEIEDEKVWTMLFHTCADNNESLTQINKSKTHLCYLLRGIGSLADTKANSQSLEINLSTDIVKRSNITIAMGGMAKFGACIGKKSVIKCTRGLKLFKGCRRKNKGEGKRRRGKGRRGNKH
ncbi:uncharacterized protein LOC124113412 [Haliotis rufescens]|uniref:uncharacterized protein LOC124113412 n=1 Tax=Haliotis rufescens TaxID=6454 RepID=UPI00201F5C2E|nr:uncharacterized protein LOC124113412 [Haliotis rufescens]